MACDTSWIQLAAYVYDSAFAQQAHHCCLLPRHSHAQLARALCSASLHTNPHTVTQLCTDLGISMETPGGKKGAPGIPNKPSKPGAGKPSHRLQKEAAANRAGPAYTAVELEEAGRKGKKGSSAGGRSSWNPNPKPLSAKQLKAAEKAALKAAKKSSKQAGSASSAYAVAAAAGGSDDGAGDEPEVQVSTALRLLTLVLLRRRCGDAAVL
jgi:hypothetical protein